MSPDVFVIGGGPAGATAAQLLASGDGPSTRARPTGPTEACRIAAGDRATARFSWSARSVDAAAFQSNTATSRDGAAVGAKRRPTPAFMCRAPFSTPCCATPRPPPAPGCRRVRAASRIRRAVVCPLMVTDGEVSGRSAHGARLLRTRRNRARTACAAATHVSHARNRRRMGIESWPADESTRTFVESYATGWAWSVPLSRRAVNAP